MLRQALREVRAHGSWTFLGRNREGSSPDALAGAKLWSHGVCRELEVLLQDLQIDGTPTSAPGPLPPPVPEPLAMGGEAAR